MKAIVWSDEYSVGVQKLDDQHKNIINLVNELHKATGISSCDQTLHDIMDKMCKYASDHLDYEESLLKEIDYPEFDDHQKGHRKYIEAVADYAIDATLEDFAIPDKLLTFLNEWWLKHILEEDMKYKPYFAKTNIK